MPKLIAIPFLLIYLVATIGASIKLHLCEGEIVRVQYFGNKNSDGCCDDDKNLNECCEDIQINIKMDGPQSINSIAFTFLQHSIWTTALPQYQWLNAISILESNLIESNYPNPPPGLWSDIPLFILYKKSKLDCEFYA